MRNRDYLGIFVLLFDILIILLIVFLVPDKMILEVQSPRIFLALFYIVVWCMLNAMYGIYFQFNEITSIGVGKRMLNISVLFLIVVYSAAVFNVNVTLKSLNFISGTSVLLIPVVIIFFRVYFLFLRKQLRSQKIAGYAEPVIIIGTGSFVEMISSGVNTRFDNHFDCLGYFSDGVNPNVAYPYLGSICEIKDKLNDCEQTHIICEFEVYVSEPGLKSVLRQVESRMNKVSFIVHKMAFNDSSLRMSINQKLPVFSFRREPLSNSRNMSVKRLFDFLFSLLVIVLLLSWLMPIIGLLIKLESRGPIFFNQVRTGFNGEDFICHKFRSMKINQDSDKVQAIRDDARLTRMGRFMRKTNIDELPQFFNVFKGEMSVVGPRPHMLAHTDFYSKEVKKYMIRHFVPPGITGLAQVNGARGGTERIEDMERRVEYDISYMENWSFMLDMKIIILTIIQIFKHNENAY